MGFHEVRFPEEISYGSRGGPGFATAVIETEAGHEQRVGRWDRPRRRYNAVAGLRSVDDIKVVTDFYVARKGALNGFRYKDWFDFTSADDGRAAPTNTDQLIATGDDATTQFTLVKRYVSGTETVVRPIQKPIAGTIVVAVNGSAQTPGTDFVVDITTGIVTFTSPPGMGLDITAGFEFDVPVRFSQDADRLLSASYDAFETGTFPDIPMVEILNPRPMSDHWWLGGASEWDTVTGVNQILIGQGRLQLVDVQTLGDELRLPDPTNLPLGGPYFYFVNTGSVDGEIADESGAKLADLVAGTSETVLLGPSGWVVL